MKNFAIGLLIFVLTACHGNESVSLSTISVDEKDTVLVDIRDASICKIVQLETTEQSLLADIEQVEIVGNKMFVYSSGNSDKVAVFDREGKFLFNVGKFGTGPGEYRRIASFFIDTSGDICLYDGDMGVILRYDENGKYLSKKEVAESSISSICPVGEDKFIGKSKYRGESVETPTLVTLNKDFEKIAASENRFLKSGVGTKDYLSGRDNDILYWEFLNDTIFHVANSAIIPRYYVDFGSRKIPLSQVRNKTIGDIINFVNSSGARYASGVRFVQDDKTHVRFVFGCDGVNYLRFNKHDKSVLLRTFYDSRAEYEIQYFMKYIDGDVVLVGINPGSNDNPCLLFMKE